MSGKASPALKTRTECRAGVADGGPTLLLRINTAENDQLLPSTRCGKRLKTRPWEWISGRELSGDHCVLQVEEREKEVAEKIRQECKAEMDQRMQKLESEVTANLETVSTTATMRSPQQPRCRPSNHTVSPTIRNHVVSTATTSALSLPILLD